MSENELVTLDTIAPAQMFPETLSMNVEIDYEILKRLCQIGCSVSVCAYAMGASVEAFKKAFERRNGSPFEDFQAFHRQHMEIGLRAKQYEKAMEGDTQMLKHLGKHILGQVDDPVLNRPADKFKNIPDNVLVQIVNSNGKTNVKKQVTQSQPVTKILNKEEVIKDVVIETNKQ